MEGVWWNWCKQRPETTTTVVFALASFTPAVLMLRNQRVLWVFFKVTAFVFELLLGEIFQ